MYKFTKLDRTVQDREKRTVKDDNNPARSGAKARARV